VREKTARTLLPALVALLGLLVLAASTGAAGRVGVGKMTVTPVLVTAASTGNELGFTFTADSAALAGRTIVDVPVGWSPPQRSNPGGAGYVELQRESCSGSTRLLAIGGRRITIATACGHRHSYRLLYHRATAPRFSADGYVFLTQTRSAVARRKTGFRPLDPHKQPVVRVRGGAATALFMTTTSVAVSGTPFNATVRAVDPYSNNATGYLGTTVTLTSTDPAASLPAPYAYGTTDGAQHTFTALVLRTPGTQRITATDSAGRSVTSGPITVAGP
jgi:hypothetical protein